MDVGEGSRIQRQPSLFQPDAHSRSSRKPHADVNTDFPANVLKPAVYYNFSKLGFKLEHTVNNPSQSTEAFLGDTPQVDDRPQEMDSVQSEIKRLKTELDKLKAEHRDINEISDKLSTELMQPAVHSYAQISALKKRKLMLKDRILVLERKISSLESDDKAPNNFEGRQFTDQDTEISEDDVKDFDLRENASSYAMKEQKFRHARIQFSDISGNLWNEPENEALREMILRLNDLGLRPETVPPHKDSYFLSLMKGLQCAGLRPRGYDFREQTVMGSGKQYPFAAKRARQDVLSLLSSQIDKLNGIAGWKLSAQEFKRYFSKAWWNVPAARDDLFMASAHLYSVRIVCYSITSEGLDEQIYDPPGDNPPRATIRVCRKGDHVISTSPAKGITDIRSVFAPPTIGKPTKLMRKRLMEENLGLFDVPDEDEKEESEAFEDLSQNEESVQEDDEIVESSAYEIQRKVGAVYETQVATKRIFATISLSEHSKVQLTKLLDTIRREFPLDSKLLDSLVRWIDPNTMHITIQTFDVPGESMDEVLQSVQEAVRTANISPFKVATGELGCFWHAAGSGWGRIPRVIWLGLDDQSLPQLVELHDALRRSCAAKSLVDPRPFCAHITLGKSRTKGNLNSNERRSLRAFGKWIQDTQRSTALQSLLEETNRNGQSRNSAKQEARAMTSGRGAKRHRSWMQKTRRHRTRERRMGELNSELFDSLVVEGGKESLVPEIEMEIAEIDVLEAVRVPGSKQVSYKKLMSLPLFPDDSACT
ncbi:hypothetical protein GUITHDRAFT_102667 [Guillardia theta CCMP2712]|uniref:Uncharacterized protein n=1 Tax=Guillardia theta (strain CCMP2712) TaxID=905079 RepID=L1JSI2_GUITC|nr:hypothetical protein GUITHDRAFT_102667 [Guillardia theta CCMP2712]EKX51397.1 hypothetical protein GUITHDRAFT_102667 [Guillardia theta CCMP2712]|eukprot:XP_005838377.1 hypothetical protein GUITHDRAFT_102667 [Guillardia theta CCMP2712]